MKSDPPEFEKIIIPPTWKVEIKVAVELLAEYLTESNKKQELFDFGKLCYEKGRDDAINGMMKLARESKAEENKKSDI